MKDHANNAVRYLRDSSFLLPKISDKFNGVAPDEDAKDRWGRLNSAVFDQYLAISQKRCKIGT